LSSSGASTPTEEGLEAAAIRGEPQRIEQRLELAQIEGVERAQDLLDRAEAIECAERRQCADQLGLVIRVPVAAMRRVERNARGILASEADPSLLEAGMGLDRERLPRGQHLEEERELCIEALGDGGPQHAGRIPCDPAVERHVSVVHDDAGGRTRVSAHPQLRLRLGSWRRQAQELGDGGVRPPGVVPDRVSEDSDASRVHGRVRIPPGRAVRQRLMAR
jgi:hypothetical protein